MGCSSNPENLETNNNQNQITEETFNKVNKASLKEPSPNKLQVSKSTNILNTSLSINQKSKKYSKNKAQKHLLS